ncbi:MAG: PLP-dependent transferase [Candidatus Micrarchaeota archaeon]|nr:PLP-dependent transferase [Candidatus Micrarchaeota archaeon]
MAVATRSRGRIDPSSNGGAALRDNVTIAPAFESGEALRRAHLAGERGDKDDLPEMYRRDGYPLLADLERDVGKLIGVTPEQLLLYGSGMSALTAAIESAHPTQGDVVMRGFSVYSQTARYVKRHLEPRGVKEVFVNSGDIDEIRETIARRSPRIIVLETVGNEGLMPVLDVEAFLALPELKALEQKPRIIIDRTLSPGIHLPELLFRDPELDIIGVESGTKFYAGNRKMLGIVYSSRGTIKELFARRKTVGGTPDVDAVSDVAQYLTRSRRDFDRMIRRVNRNTLILARACLEAAKKNPGLSVTHPNLPGHENKGLADTLARNGVTPVFYFSHQAYMERDRRLTHEGDPSLSPEGERRTESRQMKTHYLLVDLIRGDPVVGYLTEVGQSFNVQKTRLYADSDFTINRIAGSIEDPALIAELGSALRDRLVSIE